MAITQGSAGLRATRKIQVGLESPSARGTPVVATARLIGTLTPKLNQKYHRPSEYETGQFNDYIKSWVISQESAATFEGDLTYEQCMYHLGMSLRGAITPTGGGGSPYVWTYTPNQSASQALDCRTIEYGDNVQAQRMAFCFAKSIEISGQVEEAVKVKTEIVGQPLSNQSFTGSISAPTALSPVIVGTAKAYLDTSWATLGTNQLPYTVFGFDWKLVSDKGSPVTPVKYMDGNVYFTDWAEQKRHVELTIDAAYNSTIAGAFSTNLAALNQTQALMFVQLKFTGASITGGSNIFILNGAYVLDDYSELKEREGQDEVQLKFVSQLDPAASTNEWSVIVNNNVSAMT